MRYRSLLRLVSPQPRVLVGILLMSFCGSLLALANPWMAGLLTAKLTSEGATAMNLVPLFAIWFGLMLIRSLVTFASRFLISVTGETINADLRTRLYQHLQFLPIAYFHERRAGDTLTLLSADAAMISAFVTNNLVQLLPNGVTFLGALMMMAWLDWTFAVVAVFLLPAFFVFTRLIARRLRPLSRSWVDANSHLVSVLQENIGMLSAIKAFTRESHEQNRFDAANSALLDRSKRQLRVQSAIAPISGLFAGAGLLILLWIGAQQIEKELIEPAQLVTLLLLALMLLNPLGTFAEVYAQSQRTQGGAERIMEFFAESQEPSDSGDLTLTSISGEIEYRGVDFSYTRGTPVLRNFNLTISAGETIAITGKNGVGKSTLAHLLMRFADPDSGKILVDGVDIRSAKIASIRSNIGLVSQNVLLLNDTVAANITYADPYAGRARLESAAKAAYADTFINELPQAYDTVIGEHGVRLSGGQRQRISLARTLLKDPPILILDEATAMFDIETEQQFITECKSLFARKTVIIISHRPSTLQLADRIIRL